MLLMVAGVKSWSVDNELVKKIPSIAKSLGHGAQPSTPDDNQAKVISLSLDAVITPAISFDFFHSFYFLPQVVWHFECHKPVVSYFFKEPNFLITGFARIFGTYVVTNAP